MKVHTVFWGEESSEGGTEWTYQGTWEKLFWNSRLVVKRKGASLRHGMHPLPLILPRALQGEQQAGSRSRLW